MAIKTFTTGEVLTASDTNTYLGNAMSQYITSATIGNAVSTVTVSNCFSTTYDNYQIVIYGSTSSSLNNIVTLQLNNSTGSTYLSSSFYVIHSGGSTGTNSGTSSSFRITWGGNVSDTNANIILYSPFIARRTGMTSQNANASLTAFNGGTDTNAVSNTGFTIGVGADNLTGGTIAVYGFRKA
jgi:hypothetical protein